MLPKRPTVAFNDPNQLKRDRETLNLILDHSFDDWRKPTATEQLAGVTVVNPAFPPGDVRRYKGGSLQATVDEDWTAAIQAAMDANTEVFLPALNIDGSFYGLSSPLYIRDTQPQNLTLVGGGRTNVYLHPLSTDLSDATTSTNTMLFNQAGDRKFSMRNLRLWSGVAYSGVVLYCVEGGGADASGETVFSGSVDNCWFGLSSQNTGMLYGGFQNYRITNNVWEFCKSCVILEGAGNGDILFDNNQLFFCYDSFITKTDTITANLITIDNLHAYVHERGVLIVLRDCYDVHGSNISVQMNAPNLGTGGLFNVREVTHFQFDNFTAVYDTGLGTGEIAEAIRIEDSVGRFCNGTIYGADVGVRMTGSGNNRISLDGIDITNSVTAAFRVQTGSPAGLVTINNCSFSDNTLHGMLFTSEAAFDMYVSDSRFMNAGLGSVSGSRNISVATTGTARFTDCIIGQNNGASAAAAYYITAAGSAGTVTFIHPNIVGTPPTGIKDGAQAAKFIYEPLLGSATYDPANLVDGAGVTTTVTVTGAALGDFANASFSNDLQGITLTSYVSAANTVSVRFQNETGGALDLASGTLAATTQRITNA